MELGQEVAKTLLGRGHLAFTWQSIGLSSITVCKLRSGQILASPGILTHINFSVCYLSFYCTLIALILLLTIYTYLPPPLASPLSIISAYINWSILREQSNRSVGCDCARCAHSQPDNAYEGAGASGTDQLNFVLLRNDTKRHSAAPPSRK